MQLSKRANRIISIILALFAVLFVLQSFIPNTYTYGATETESYGVVVRGCYVKASSIHMRDGAGTSYNSLGTINQNTRLYILSEEKDSDSKVWYYCLNPSNGKYGYVSSWNVTEDTDLNLREAIGNTSNITKELTAGSMITIISKSDANNVDGSGVQWYYVKNNDGVVGYISSRYVAWFSTDAESFDFYLTIEGFPESYKPYLRELHTKYPKWVFTAAHTGVDFNAAVKKEANEGGKTAYKLVNTSMPESYRSTARYRYSLVSGTDYDYTGYVVKKDGGSYYGASTTAIAYYMDPRNWLTPTYVYMFIMLSYDETTQTKEGLQSLLKGTFMEGEFPEEEFETWADALMQAAKESGVSPYEIASKICQEQGNDGHGKSISGTYPNYEGYYNFYNIGAAGEEAIKNGLIYASGSGSYGRPWNTRYKSILGGALWYGSGYVTSANHQDTKYFVMWNTNNGLAKIPSHQYATFIGGASSEASIVKKAYANLTDNPLVFKIPVYLNMGDTASPKPPETGNNLYYLSSLTIEGFTLDGFDPYKENYELVVDKSTVGVTLKATTFDSGAKVDGLGYIELGAVGTVTTVNIKVTATAGTTKTYTLKISRAKTGGQKQKVVYNPTYSVQANYLTGIPGSFAFSDFYATYEVGENETFTLLDKESNPVNSGYVGTGMKVEIKNEKNEVVNTYEIKIKGDITGEGKINSSDVLLMQKHIVGKTELKDVYLDACDANDDGKINSSDVLIIQKYIVGKGTINQ